MLALPTASSGENTDAPKGAASSWMTLYGEGSSASSTNEEL